MKYVFVLLLTVTFVQCSLGQQHNPCGHCHPEDCHLSEVCIAGKIKVDCIVVRLNPIFGKFPKGKLVLLKPIP